MDNRTELLKKLSAAQFAGAELQLYLDTHPDDANALKLLESYQAKAAELKKQFEDKFGPITPDDVFGETSFKWVNNPWPWERGE